MLFMTKLEKLYSIIENSRDVGVKLPKGVLQQVEELEEEIIKKEILPVVTETIAPALKQVQRELVLVVDYNPNSPISVHLSLRRTSRHCWMRRLWRLIRKWNIKQERSIESPSSG